MPLYIPHFLTTSSSRKRGVGGICAVHLQWPSARRAEALPGPARPGIDKPHRRSAPACAKVWPDCRSWDDRLLYRQVSEGSGLSQQRRHTHTHTHTQSKQNQTSPRTTCHLSRHNNQNGFDCLRFGHSHTLVKIVLQVHATWRGRVTTATNNNKQQTSTLQLLRSMKKKKKKKKIGLHCCWLGQMWLTATLLSWKGFFVGVCRIEHFKYRIEGVEDVHRRRFLLFGIVERRIKLISQSVCVWKRKRDRDRDQLHTHIHTRKKEFVWSDGWYLAVSSVDPSFGVLDGLHPFWCLCFVSCHKEILPESTKTQPAQC